jgi:predicted Zn finger-like uncharacterized protein
MVQSDGSPPERYQLQYRIESLRQKDGQLVAADTHLVEIFLPRNYPRVPPLCRMLTPVFHPNIAPHAICIGDHWSAGEPLVSIVARIGELLAYQSYNTKSPLNGEAARWVSENEDRLPLDPVGMLVEEESPPSETPPLSPKAAFAPVIAPQEPPSRKAAFAPVIAPPVRSDDEPVFVTPLAPPVVVPENLIASCPQCGSKLRVLLEHSGRDVRCPRCKTVFRIH